MNQIKWNIKELRGLLINKYGDVILSRFEGYISTIHLKKRKADYHAEKSEKLWKELFNRSAIRFSSRYFRETMDSATTDVEAMVQALHSTGDILAQVVNLAVLGSKGLLEEKVNVNQVLKRMKKQKIALDVQKPLLLFKKSDEFQYISAFCNTIKHRKLLDIKYHTHCDFIKKGVYRIEEGVRFKEFTYRGKTFPVTWSHIIIGEYRAKIYKMLCDVGISINNYLKQGV